MKHDILVKTAEVAIERVRLDPSVSRLEKQTSLSRLREWIDRMLDRVIHDDDEDLSK